MPGCFHCCTPRFGKGLDKAIFPISHLSRPATRCVAARTICPCPQAPRLGKRDGSLAAPCCRVTPRPCSLLPFALCLVPGACACACACAGGWVLTASTWGHQSHPLRSLGLPPRSGMPLLAKAPRRRQRTKTLMRQSCVSCAPLPADEPWDITAITTRRLAAHQCLSLSTPPPFLSRGIASTALAGRCVHPWTRDTTAATGRLD